MKALFIEARYKKGMRLPDAVIKKLPKTVILFTTVQYLNSLNRIKKQLEQKNKNVILIRAQNTKYDGQVLGCNIGMIGEKADCILFVGDGMFHPVALGLNNQMPVFVFNPMSRKFFEVGRDEFIKEATKVKGALMKVHASKNIGVLVSLKHGQNHLDRALKLKEQFKEKNFYFLLFDTISFSDLENFPFIECYINTACPRIAVDDRPKIRKPIVNMDDLSLYI
ncbi:diphthamide synthesis protein [Candidatus Woesearchaeota archaeon]|nr:diphthamide synthesis protein [Candidatus Woesearchaeota archaeon]